MGLPAFFDQAPRVQVRDRLAELLGAADGGLLEYSYADAVRLAGHSCPTVAGTWLMARAGLRALYPDALAERGNIEVHMAGREDEGTTGVIAQIFTLLTGAAADNGFHGIGSQHGRKGLLRYAAATDGSIAHLRRRDNGARVALGMDLSSVPAAANLRPLMQQALAPDAGTEVRAAFADAWQDGVRRLLLEHADDPDVIQARLLA